MLLQAKADPNTAGCKAIGSGNSVLHQAVLKGDTAMVNLLLLHASAVSLDVNGEGRGGWTPLGLAVRAGNAVVVQALLEGGADPAFVMASGKTALDIAHTNDRKAIVDLLTK